MGVTINKHSYEGYPHPSPPINGMRERDFGVVGLENIRSPRPIIALQPQHSPQSPIKQQKGVGMFSSPRNQIPLQQNKTIIVRYRKTASC